MVLKRTEFCFGGAAEVLDLVLLFNNSLALSHGCVLPVCYAMFISKGLLREEIWTKKVDPFYRVSRDHRAEADVISTDALC